MKKKLKKKKYKKYERKSFKLEKNIHYFFLFFIYVTIICYNHCKLLNKGTLFFLKLCMWSELVNDDPSPRKASIEYIAIE